jgi:hypothetical protein
MILLVPDCKTSMSLEPLSRGLYVINSWSGFASYARHPPLFSPFVFACEARNTSVHLLVCARLGTDLLVRIERLLNGPQRFGHVL